MTRLARSLKSATRSFRGSGIRRRVESNSLVQRNWQSFLRNEDNKTELFSYLARQAMTIHSEKQVVSTIGENVVFLQEQNNQMLSPCNQEEADGRIFLHVADAISNGFRKVLIRTTDTDVVVLAISVVQQVDVEELWIWFGVGKHQRFIPAHEIARNLGPLKSKCLTFFHAYTGCDNVSFFRGIGKKTTFDIWNVYPEVTGVFMEILQTQEITQHNLAFMERYAVMLYDRTSKLESVNEARMHLFTQKHRQIENIPPSSAA